MVCRVISGKSIKGALNYNESKVREGLAECIGAANFIAEPEQLNFYNKLSRFENLIEKNGRAKTNAVHISLNFDVGEKLSQTKLNEIATTYMNKIGFGDQPYLVYEHRDAAHPHLHIVTTNIQEDGKRISIHNLGKNHSEQARKEIEEKYGLVKAGSKQKQGFEPTLSKAIYGKSETKRTINNIVAEVMKRYKFASLTELNAVLRQYNVMADRGKEGMTMFDKNGLIYTMLDSKGNKVGVPIKASALYCKPTMKNLDGHFKLGGALKEVQKGRLIKIIDSFFHATDRHTRVNFCDYMNFYGVNTMFRENKDGRIYGLTFIDNRKGAVFNGSDLGKQYSGQAVIKRFGIGLVAGEKESQERIDREFERQFERFDHTQANWTLDIPKGFLDLMKAEKFYPGPTNPLPRRKKKPRRKKSI
ncbi:relaxase/mobilization nuclease domain-containing protein [Chryseolinea sp. H1M3-3]|uniref:relaxase/mobilization nuclease domain-containing protein n=1 Tax=Chryseolinea sp. H1M3-3 TaxID=3034144 RepID=UPI0023EB139E|nr:relaxase/mobilization nuclease domain-containing protein [Chryseolinea sp. H1M3-3]